jgi:hypothetical protein
LTAANHAADNGISRAFGDKQAKASDCRTLPMLISHDFLPSLDRRGPERQARFGLSTTTLFVIGAYFAITFGLALSAPFPTMIDELQHFSVIRAQFEQPTIFPDWSRYRVLSAGDLTQWSTVPNYINHPSLYYLLLAPLMAITGNPLVFRLVNVMLSTGALTIVVIAANRRFAHDVVPPTLFAIIAACFPKAAVVGGMINNDNLAAVAAAALFAGLLSVPGEAWWIASALAIAGWTKLTVFVALAAIACASLVLRLLRRDRQRRDLLPLIAGTGAGILVGAIPYIVTFLRIGQLVWVCEAAWRIPLAARVHLDFAGFSRHFLEILALKWPAGEGVYPFWAAVAGLGTLLIMAIIGLRDTVLRPLGMAYAAGVVVLFMVHLAFAWHAFRTMGDLTIVQTRYYGALWPGVALTATAGARRIGRHWRPAEWIMAAICLSPTILGGMIFAVV